MKRDSRLSVALHVLLHMSEADGAMTSEELGRIMMANPVVLRRTMGGLRDAGIVRSVKGHGGGWSLARDLADVTLVEVYDALGMPTVFSIGPRDESPGCLVEKAVNHAIEDACAKAEAVLLSELKRTTVASLASAIRKHTGDAHPMADFARGKAAPRGKRQVHV